MVDFIRDRHGRIRARLVDLLPGRPGEAHSSWLRYRGDGRSARP